MENEEIKKIFNQYGVDKVEVLFDCGGDSMNSIEVLYYDEEDNKISLPSDVYVQLSDQLESKMYDVVEFYEVGDGIYQGESGIVEIFFDADELKFKKSSTQHFEEPVRATIDITEKLNSEQIDFLKSKVSNFNYDGMSNNDDLWNYKTDLILSEYERTIQKDLSKIIDDIIQEQPTPELEGDIQERLYVNYTCELISSDKFQVMLKLESIFVVDIQS
jgi:hypothetical protein